MIHVHKFPSSLVFILVWLVEGCTSLAANYSDLNNSFPIDPLFREFYTQKGGKTTLGPGISPVFSHGRNKYQYTVSGLMVFDSQDGVQQHISFAPLGKEMRVLQPFLDEQSNTTQADNRMNLILEEFIPFYEKLGGVSVVGEPLNLPRFNPDKGRYEQFFSSLGFYRLVGDELGSVKLLTYGIWKCGQSCEYNPSPASEVVLPEPIDAIFAPWTQRVGLDFTGYALSPRYIEMSGEIVQIFENIVLTQGVLNPEQISPSRLPEKLGIFPDLPKNSSVVQGMIFVPVQDEFGYLVPQLFYDFIQHHGGFGISGLPISDFKPFQEKINQQCFEYICLQEDKRVNGILRVHPAPLGFMYMQMDSLSKRAPILTNETQSVPMDVAGVEKQLNDTRQDYLSAEVIIQVWESTPWISAQQSQDIFVSIRKDDNPVKSIEPELTVYLPKNEKWVIKMPPTDKKGESMITLSHLSAPNGTLIPYQVCVTMVKGNPSCQQGDFLIWFTPDG